jgi:glutathione S-transferase
MPPPTLKLHGMPASTNYQRAWIYMAEKGFPFEPVMVDLMKGENKSPEYLQLNPRGQIPCLEIVGTSIVVYESTAIIQYLEHKHRTTNPSLMPTSDAELAVCFTRQAEFLAKLEDTDMLGSIIFEKQGIAELGDRVTKLFKELQVWDGYLENKEYLAGTTFSIADIYVFPFVAPYYHLCKLPMAKFPNLGAWYKRVKNRPAMKDCEFFTAVDEMAAGAGNTNPGVFAGIN